MKTYFLLFVVATASSLVLTPVVRRVCERFGWLDVPRDERRLHKKAIPRLGGIAIFVSVLVGLMPLLLIRNLVTDGLGARAPRLMLILVPATLTLALGVYDDLFGMKAPPKFAGLATIGVVFYAMGGRIENVSIPFVGSVHLPMIIGLVLTVVWIVSIANAFNLLDGMDGLAAGAAVFSSLVIMCISLIQGRPSVIALALVLSGALVGFLRYNFNPASIFLGDSGALFVGFVLAALSVEGTQKASTAVAVAIPIMAFGLPMLDTSFTIVRRFVSRKPLFHGDREHIHHMLLERGWSQKRTALVLYAVCATFGLLTLLFVGNSGPLTGLVLFIVGVAVVIAVSHLRYHEVDELRAGVKRNLGDRRVRGANNIKVRKATRKVTRANTLAELCDAVVEVLEIGEFERAVLILGCTKDPNWNAHVLAREQEAPALRFARMRQGMIYWYWAGEDLEPTDPDMSPECWALRLPLGSGNGVVGHLNLYRRTGQEDLLLDINYLCTRFHSETSKAAERVLEQKLETEQRMAARA